MLDLNENCYILRAPWGGVLQIYRLLLFNDNAPDGESYISEIEVYKVDFVEQKRIKMTGIGQYALFIGRNTTSCFSVKDYPELLPNHIYFTDDPYDLIDWENDPRKIGVYNLENKTTSSVVYPELWMTWLPPIWLTPSLAKSRYYFNFPLNIISIFVCYFMYTLLLDHTFSHFFVLLFKSASHKTRQVHFQT